MKRFQSKKHKIGTYKIKKKYHYRVLIKKDLFEMMGFTHLLILLKSYKNRFTQMIINKKRFSQIKMIKKDSHKKKRFS